MKLKPLKAKPMSEDTKELGRRFVRALLDEGHDYDSVKANFIASLANETMAVANKKLSASPGAMLQTSGHVFGAILESSKMLGMHRNGFAKLFHVAQEMAAIR